MVKNQHTDPAKNWKFKFPKTNIINKIPYFKQICNGKTVLHIGCTDHLELIDFRIIDGTHVHTEIMKESTKVHGVDLDIEAMDYLKSKYDIHNIINYDISSDEKPSELYNDYDIILIPEVLEHIENVKDFMLGIKKFMRDDSLLILSTPNAHNVHNFFTAFGRYEQVNPDHVNYYSYMTLKGLLEKLDFTIIEWNIYIYGVAQRPFLKYGVRWFGSILKSILIEMNPWFGDGIVVVAKKK